MEDQSKVLDAQLAELQQYGPCDVADALMKMQGYPQGGYIPDLEAYSPATPGSSDQPTVVGPAFTVKMVLASDKTSPTPSDHFVDAAPSGCIMIISAPSNLKNAVWGGLMSAGAAAHGVRATIVDGRVRDLAEHRRMSYPLWARGHSVLGQGGFTRPSELGGSVTIVPLTSTSSQQSRTDHFPGVIVETGDIVIAGQDGVVAFRAKDLPEVLDRVRKNTAIDEKCMRDISQGRPIAETFKEHRGK